MKVWIRPYCHGISERKHPKGWGQVILGRHLCATYKCGNQELPNCGQMINGPALETED